MKRTGVILAILALLFTVAVWWRLRPAATETRQSLPDGSKSPSAVTNPVSANVTEPAATASVEEDFLIAATNKALRVRCINNLKQIGLAARVWARKNKTNAMPGDKEALKQYLGDPENVEKVLRCPADEKAGYEFLSPGAPENNSQIVYASCPVHNNVGLVDGSAHQLDADHQVIQKDGKWIFGR